LKVDKVAEDLFIERLKKEQIPAVVLSEEIQRIEVGETAQEKEKIYFVSDPFDGTLLYKRQIPAFWYTSLSIYGEDRKIKTALVGDCSQQTVDFTDGEKAYTGLIKAGQIKNLRKLKPNKTELLKDAFLETYLMKPHYMYPTAVKFKPLFEKVKFILPNGGPAGFSDVASGKVDVYLAVRQPFVDVFTGLGIAEAAGAIVTSFTGERVEFADDINQRYNIICAANPSLHQQVLEIISQVS
jgi:fructose-1,6-bisphosphatase/inositol monophosphatase family enzyme